MRLQVDRRGLIEHRDRMIERDGGCIEEPGVGAVEGHRARVDARLGRGRGVLRREANLREAAAE